jgi:hypothetical protein
VRGEEEEEEGRRRKKVLFALGGNAKTVSFLEYLTNRKEYWTNRKNI